MEPRVYVQVIAAHTVESRPREKSLSRMDKKDTANGSRELLRRILNPVTGLFE
jgi:hypothetical protein